MPKPIAIIAAPNGARRNKSDHPNLPITVEEIVQESLACAKAGASMVHVHARDQEGRHTLGIEENSRLYQALKQALGEQTIIQLTTEAVGQFSPQQQRALIQEIEPEAASFALRELIPTSYIDSQTIEFFQWLEQREILSQFILYNTQDVTNYLKLIEEQRLPRWGRHCLLVLGKYGAQVAHPNLLLPLLNLQLCDAERWASCAFGQYEHQCLAAAMLLGGDVRVGFENNLHSRIGQLAPSTADLVAELVNSARHFNIELTDASRYRQTLMGGHS